MPASNLFSTAAFCLGFAAPRPHFSFVQIRTRQQTLQQVFATFLGVRRLFSVGFKFEVLEQARV